MSQEDPVRIVLVMAPAGADPRTASLPTLQRLGGGVLIETVPQIDAAVARTEEREVDLVVMELGIAPEDVRRLLGDLGPAGPPVIPRVASFGPDRALDYFRHGAADCVSDGPAGEGALAAAALEQIRLRRAARESAQARNRLRTLRSKMHQIVENLDGALVVVDPDGRVEYANAGAADLLGEDPDALTGRLAASWFRDGPPEESAFARSLEKRERIRGHESSLVRTDGQRVPVSVSCSPLCDEAGGDLGAVAMIEDLSGRKALEQQLVQREKMASIGQLAAGLAHEINNPVGFVHANLFQVEEYVDALRGLWRSVRGLQDAVRAGRLDEAKRHADALEIAARRSEADYVLEDLAAAVRESRQGTERVRQIVSDLRAFSQADTPDRVWTDVNQCLDVTANIAWGLVKHEVEIHKDYGEVPPLHAHPGQLRQIFMNLLVNAYQAISDTPSGRGHVELRTRSENGGVRVDVRDDGPGIAPEDLGRVFDPFFTTRPVGVGNGLGLSTALGLARAQGGTIRAESVPGEGACFRVWLPTGQAGEATAR